MGGDGGKGGERERETGQNFQNKTLYYQKHLRVERFHRGDPLSPQVYSNSVFSKKTLWCKSRILPLTRWCHQPIRSDYERVINMIKFMFTRLVSLSLSQIINAHITAGIIVGIGSTFTLISRFIKGIFVEGFFFSPPKLEFTHTASASRVCVPAQCFSCIPAAAAARSGLIKSGII